jgi:hypothetical protein
MALGSFPPLHQTQVIKEFDGSPERLSDFITSIECHLAAYNIPLSQGGYVSGNMDDGWTFVSRGEHAAHPTESRLNYVYGSRLCLLLGERLTHAARDWWIARKEGGSGMPNCWERAPRELRDAATSEISMKDILITQFSNPREIETALFELDRITWDPASETLISFKTRIISLLTRTRVKEFIMQRNYILKAFSNDIRRAIRQPPTVLELWQLAQDYYITEESIKSSPSSSDTTTKKTVKTPPKEKRDKSDVTCFTCGEKGHYSPDCPKGKEKRRGKEPEGASDDDLCYKCGGKGHRSTVCPTAKATKEGEIAKKQRTARRPTVITPTPTPKLHFDARDADEQSQLGAQWRSPSYHHFDTVPIPKS